MTCQVTGCVPVEGDDGQPGQAHAESRSFATAVRQFPRGAQSRGTGPESTASVGGFESSQVHQQLVNCVYWHHPQQSKAIAGPMNYMHVLHDAHGPHKTPTKSRYQLEVN
jgi:hypothetical protein